MQSNPVLSPLNAYKVLRRPLLLLGLAALTAPGYAGLVYKAGNNDNLNLGSSWTGGAAPTANDVAVWDSTVTAANTVNLGATANWAGIQILNPGGAVNITNVGTTLFIGASGVDTSGGTQTLTLSCPVVLVTNSANNVWNLGANVTIAGGLTGTNILQKTGSGTLNLSTGTGAATIQIDSGVVSVNASSVTITNALNGGTVNINAAVSNPINVLSGGGTEQNAGGNRTWSGSLFGSGPLTVNASATHTWNGNNTNYTGTITLQGSGSLRLSSVNSVSAGTAYNFNGGTMNANVSPAVFNLGSLAGSGSLLGGSGKDFSIGALNANTDFGGVISGASIVTKLGTGTQTLSGANTYTGNTIVSNGVLQLGNGGSSGSLASPVVFLTNSTSILSFNRSDSALNVTNAITGIGQVQQDGSGTTFLSGPSGGAGANNYTGGSLLNNGTLKFATGALGTGGIAFNNGATLQWAPGNTTDISSQTVTISSSGAMLDVNGNTVTLANAIGNGSSGSLTVKSTLPDGVLNLQGANTYAGGTYISSGTLRANNSTGSATGTGYVSVYQGATLGGSGIISGTVDVQGALAPGNGVGTLRVGSLTLQYNATNNFEFNSTPANDKVVVTTPDGLAIYGGVFNLYAEGSIAGWSTPGTYNLIQYSGTAPSLDSSWTTSSAANPHIGNPQTGCQYAFSASGGFLRLTITLASTVVVGTWNVDVNGNWSDATKWSSNPKVPHAAGDTATFGTGTALRTVTLDAAETVGALTLNNSNSFVIANSGNALTLDNSGSGVAVTVSAGTANAIQSAVTLNDHALLTIAANKALALSGAVGNGSAAKSLVVNGAGTLALSGNNTYGPAAGAGFGTTLTDGGTLQVGHNNALGVGDVSIAGNGTLQAGAAGLNLPNNIDVAYNATATVDNNGNNLTLSGAISDGGSLVKNGSGTLTLAGNNSYYGNTTVNAGVLSLAADANVAGTPNIILNGGGLLGNGTFALSSGHAIGVGPAAGTAGANALIDAASGQVFEVDGIIGAAGNSGTNNLVVNSGLGNNGTVALAAANTFNGTTVISNGTLRVMNSQALQNSLLLYDSGTLTFSGVSSATLGGLSGTRSSQELALTNDASGAVTLTVGGNGASTIFGGNLSGAGALTKSGAGTLVLSNANYTGATTVGGGSLAIYGGSFGSSSSGFTVGAASGVVSNATMNASSVRIGTGGGQTGASLALKGTATATNTSVTIGSSGNTAGNLTVDTSGNVSLGAVALNRDAGSTASPSLGSGLIVNQGTVTATNVTLAQSGVSGRGANLNLKGGSLTIGDASSTGAFTINSSTGNGFVTLQGGSLTYLGTDGLLMSVGGGVSALTLYGGTATLIGVTLNATNSATVTSTLSMFGTNGTPALYLGSLGLVANQPSATVSVTVSNAAMGAIADWSSTAPMTLAGNLTLQAADGASIPHNIILSGVLSGPGGVTKTGGGTVTLSGANTCTGNTLVQAGTLEVQQAWFATNSTVSVSNGASLSLAFTGTNPVSGLVLNGVSQPKGVYSSANSSPYLAGSGYLQVEPPISTNAFLASLTLSPSGVLSPAFTPNGFVYGATNAFANNPVEVTATAADPTATLQLSLNGGAFGPLVSSLPSSAQTLSLAPPANTLRVLVTAQDGVTTNLYTVNVMLQPSLQAFKLANTVAGGNLTLSWPADHTGYRLLVQTNNLNNGVSTNAVDWATYADSDSTATNQVTLPIEKTNKTGFYRLVYP